jgi:hypothetical protein
MDLANKGHLVIFPNGVVSVFAEGNISSNASSFTSFDGASFAP